MYLVRLTVFLGLSLIAVSAGLNGCSDGLERREWSEEVLLDDGRPVTVKRTVEYRVSNSIAGDAYSTTGHKSLLTFKGELGSLPKWVESLTPLVLYWDDATREWVLVAASSRCEVWSVRGKPLPPYWEFRARGTGWLEVPLSKASLGRQTNLFLLYEQTAPQSHLTAEEKKRLHDNEPIAEKSLGIQKQVDESYCSNWRA